MEVSQEQSAKRPTMPEINTLKKKHGRLYEVEVAPDNDDENSVPLVFLFTKPDRKTLSAVMKVSQTDPMLSAEIMVKNCLVWGDEKALDDNGIFMAVSEQFEQINTARTATIKNL